MTTDKDFSSEMQQKAPSHSSVVGAYESATTKLRQELGDEPWSLEKIALAFATVSGNMEAVYETEQDYKGSTRSTPPDPDEVEAIQSKSESSSSISSTLAEIRERRSKVPEGHQLTYWTTETVDILLSIIDSLQAEKDELRQGLINTTKEVASRGIRIGELLEEVDAAASNMKAEIVKRVREKADHHNQDCITRMLRSLHSTCHCPATAFAELATELESVEVKEQSDE